MSRLSRTKGRTYEQDVARRLRELLPGVDVRRGWQSDGREAPDVICGPFAVECKHRKALSVPQSMADAEAHAPQGTHPVLFAKWHGGDEVVCMRVDDWAEIVTQWWKARTA